MVSRCGGGCRVSATASVYRFFDVAHGTHLFTTSSAERDQVIATRSDL